MVQVFIYLRRTYIHYVMLLVTFQWVPYFLIISDDHVF